MAKEISASRHSMEHMMMNAPDTVEQKQLDELAIRIDEAEVEAIEAAQK